MPRTPELPDAPHINSLEKNFEDVEELLQIEAHVSADKECSHDSSVLYRSAVVLLAACWESVVEDLVAASITAMIAGPADAIPDKVRGIVCKNLGTDTWKLAGDGWRQEMRNHLKGILGSTIQQWHNPKSDRVDILFEGATGISSVSSSWKWRGMTVSQARKKLDSLVAVRGAIAHRVRGSDSVTRRYVESHATFIRGLACKTSNLVGAHLKRVTGTVPWSPYYVDFEDGTRSS